MSSEVDEIHKSSKIVGKLAKGEMELIDTSVKRRMFGVKLTCVSGDELISGDICLLLYTKSRWDCVCGVKQWP